MSRETLLDASLVRHDVARCDGCADVWTLNVCKMREWLLSDERDLCERCLADTKVRRRRPLPASRRGRRG